MERPLAAFPGYSNWEYAGKSPPAHTHTIQILLPVFTPKPLFALCFHAQAVEELLNGGANPNIPLGASVGSALCAFANIHYTLDDRKEKLVHASARELSKI